MRRLAIMAATVAAAVAVSAKPATAQTQVTCESQNGRQNVCAMDTRGGVRITKYYSLSPCEQGQTWGVTRGGVWVSGGCRATFQSVGVASGSGNYGTYDRYGRNTANGTYNNAAVASAENMCRQAVRQRVGNRRLTTQVQNVTRNNVRVVWQTANGYSGSCRVNSNGNVTLNMNR
jgi:hypothetical protein